MKTEQAVEFTKKLAQYKREIDADIETYSKHVQKNTLQTYGANSRVATDAYLDILNRGGKRIRGALAMAGYEMCGGTNKEMILQAARAVEMIHAYILIIDDVTDRSHFRRGGPSAHVSLSEYYSKQGYGDDQQHFGESVAVTASLIGNHAAQMILANLDVSERLRLNTISILNRGMIVTVHGQFHDIFNQVTGGVSEEEVVNTTKWKTAHYTFLNPLHIGMILAGADCHSTDAITDYAMNMGQAFQLTDDVLGTFGSEFDVGKSPMDDLREGKQTLLAVYALKYASETNKNYLIQMLGNQHITQAEFKRCQDIFIATGALDYSKKQTEKYISLALRSLNNESYRWSKDGTEFLSGMANYLLLRNN